jgi:hypothetical protein
LFLIDHHGLGIYAENIHGYPFAGIGILVKILRYHIIDPDLVPRFQTLGHSFGLDPAGIQHDHAFTQGHYGTIDMHS